MAALTLARMILQRTNERIAENHKEMDKGVAEMHYQRLVGANRELTWVQGICREFLVKVEAEEEVDEL